MKRQYLLASSISEVSLNVPAQSLDLSQWFFGLSDLEYQECAKGHVGAGVGRLPSGKRTSLNVESIGGHLTVQHYVEEASSASHLKLVSERSDVWIFHLIHIHPRVTCEMNLVPTSDHTCTFQCKITAEHPSALIKVASVLFFVPFFVRRHDQEEVNLFAASLAQSPNKAL